MNKRKNMIILVGVALIVCAVVFFIFKGIKVANVDTFPVGTWYSDKPDMLTFSKKGEYKAASWNGGNPWLLSGSYNLSGDTVTLIGILDGSVTLRIETGEDSAKRLVGAHIYYDSEGKAKAAIEEKLAREAEEEKNLIPNIKKLLLGDWISLDEKTTCVYTETTIEVHFTGSEYSPEKTLLYEYEVIDDKRMYITEDGRRAIGGYNLYQKDGEWYLFSPVESYASSYKKVSQ
jgi:hypothetical protein